MIDCVSKSYECHEADPHFWGGIRESGQQLLATRELERYRDLIPDDEDLQREWEAAVDDPLKYVELLIGQKSEDEQREETDEENYYPPFEAEQETQNYFLAYHQVKAHLRYIATRPAEAEVYRRFQVSPFVDFMCSLIGSVSLTRVFHRCGTVIRWTRGMPRVSLWGMVGMDVPLSRSRLWLMLMRMAAVTVVVMLGRRVRWTRMERGFHCMGVDRRSSWVPREVRGRSRGNNIISRCGVISLILAYCFISFLKHGTIIVPVNPCPRCNRPWYYRRRP